MNEIIVKTQEELDKVDINFRGRIYIHGGTYFDMISVSKTYPNAYVVAQGSSHVVAWGSSHIEARESSHVEARESSHVVAWESSHIVAWESSHIEARGSSHVEARESSHVEAQGSSHVVAWGSSHIEARESSHVVAWDYSHIEARGSSHVVAWGSSHVVAWGSSHIEARESSHVEARESVSVTSLSSMVEVTLFFFAVCINKAKSKVIKKSKTCTEIKVPEMKGSFLEYQQEYPVKVKGKIATMYKAVHKYEDGTYHADYNKDYVYEIGKEYTEKCSPKESGSCSEGLHLAHKSWAKSFGIGWSDMALLECEVNIKDIVVSKDTDGKLRASKIKIIREVPKSEY